MACWCDGKTEPSREVTPDAFLCDDGSYRHRVVSVNFCRECGRELGRRPVLAHSDRELVARAIMNASGQRSVDTRTPLWSAIGAAFGIGSTSSRNLCRAFGYDPEFYALAPLKRIEPDPVIVSREVPETQPDPDLLDALRRSVEQREVPE